MQEAYGSEAEHIQGELVLNKISWLIPFGAWATRLRLKSILKASYSLILISSFSLSLGIALCRSYPALLAGSGELRELKRVTHNEHFQVAAHEKVAWSANAD